MVVAGEEPAEEAGVVAGLGADTGLDPGCGWGVDMAGGLRLPGQAGTATCRPSGHRRRYPARQQVTRDHLAREQTASLGSERDMTASVSMPLRRRPGGVLRQLRAGAGRGRLPLRREVPGRERHDHRQRPADDRDGDRPARRRAARSPRAPRAARGGGCSSACCSASSAPATAALDRLGAHRAAHRLSRSVPRSAAWATPPPAAGATSPAPTRSSPAATTCCATRRTPRRPGPPRPLLPPRLTWRISGGWRRRSRRRPRRRGSPRPAASGSGPALWPPAAPRA